VIANPIKEETEEISKAGIITKKEPSNVARARVVSVPKSQPKFRDEAFKVTEVKVGDVVITRPFYQLELDKTYASETKLVRILTGVIMATE
jgi:co-chaperonin GroES (HSP10)